MDRGSSAVLGCGKLSTAIVQVHGLSVLGIMNDSHECTFHSTFSPLYQLPNSQFCYDICLQKWATKDMPTQALKKSWVSV